MRRLVAPFAALDCSEIIAIVRSSPAFIVPLLCLLTPQLASAQNLETVSVRLDNDILALRGTGPPPDYDYTHGLQVAAEFRGVPRGFSCRANLQSEPGVLRLRVGQRVYTPRQDAPEPIPGERPYAAWLYAGADLVLSCPGTEHTVSLEIGVTGPAALGEQVQNGFHNLVGSQKQEGWNNQLGTEPAVLTRYRMAWPRQHAGLRFRPYVEAAVGTLWTGAAGGVMLRAGTSEHGRGWYAEAEVRQEWVARNLLLDGNTFQESERANKRPWVTQAAAGAGFIASRWGLEYSFIVRSCEYEAQPVPHGYGSVVLTWRR